MDCRGPLKCVKLFNFRLVEITNPSMYVCANNIVSYAKFMDRVARSTDICAIHGFLHRVWIHRLRKQIHGYRRSTDCAQHGHILASELYLGKDTRASDFPFPKKAIFRFKKSEIPFRFRFIIGNVEFDEITIYRKKVR